MLLFEKFLLVPGIFFNSLFRSLMVPVGLLDIYKCLTWMYDVLPH